MVAERRLGLLTLLSGVGLCDMELGMHFGHLATDAELNSYRYLQYILSEIMYVFSEIMYVFSIYIIANHTCICETHVYI